MICEWLIVSGMTFVLFYIYIIYTLLLHYYTADEEKPLIPNDALQIQYGMLLDYL